MNYKEQQQNRLKLRDWAAEDQPVCKIAKNGSKTLTDTELLSILLGGSNNDDSLETARLMMSESGNNLCELGKITMSNLMKYKGVGKAKASMIIAAFEIGRREHSSQALTRKQICNSRDIYESMQAKFYGLDHEECWILLMNNQHKVMDTIRISHGGVSETTVDPKIVMKHALDKLSSSIAVCHNHPSGKPQPSSCDDRITKKLENACEMLDIQFTDHLIFGEKVYYSYADEGRL